MIDLSSRPAEDKASAKIVRLIDKAIVSAKSAEKPRNYLGGSRLGVECLRALGYEYHHTPVDAGREFNGKTYRIFQAGHEIEADAGKWLQAAGFDLRTEDRHGFQYGFKTAIDPETGEPRLAGHLDGVFVNGPKIDGVGYPCLWEMKTMNTKNFAKLVKDGVKKSKPVYYTQMQVYMHHMGLTDFPALFTAYNKDTSDLQFELVPFDAEHAQWAIDRGVQVIQSQTPEELPRITSDPADRRCMWCNWARTCHKQPAAAPMAKPSWMG
jgi:hypothetical protein